MWISANIIADKGAKVKRDFTKRQIVKNKVESASKSDIIQISETSDGELGLQIIGKIDLDKYSCVAENIRSDTVVLTDNQREHIIKRRGQVFFDKYSPYFAEVAEQPDYIFRDTSHEHTAIASKTLAIDGKHLHIVIHLALESDEPGLENSIITAIIENDKRYFQRLRNNIALYKKE